MVSTKKSFTSTGRTACWQDEWWSEGFVSSCLHTQAGISTTNSTRNSKRTGTSPINPAAALIKDLKQRGLLDSTMIVWGGEFGRTPMAEVSQAAKGSEDGAGRDHHPTGYTMWLAGGGIKGGQVVGQAAVLGLSVVKDKVLVHDLQATILHCLGLEHTNLTYRHMGRDFRLTDVEGKVVKKMLA